MVLLEKLKYNNIEVSSEPNRENEKKMFRSRQRTVVHFRIRTESDFFYLLFQKPGIPVAHFPKLQFRKLDVMSFAWRQRLADVELKAVTR